MLLPNCLNESLSSGTGIRYILGHIKGRKNGPAPAFIAGPSDLQTREQSVRYLNPVQASLAWVVQVSCHEAIAATD